MEEKVYIEGSGGGRVLFVWVRECVFICILVAGFFTRKEKN